MELTVLERLVLLNNLPEKGNATTLKIVRQLLEDLSFDEDEHATLNFQQKGEQLHWNTTDYTKDVTIGPKAMVLVIETLEQLDKQEQLPRAALGLYERLVEETTEDTTE